MALIVTYIPSGSIAKAMFNFDMFGYSDFKLSGQIYVSVSDGFNYADYYYGYFSGVNATKIYDSVPEYDWSPTQISNIKKILDVYASFANLSFASTVTDWDYTPYSSIANPKDVGYYASIGNIYSDINISLVTISGTNNLGISGVNGAGSGFYYTGSNLDVFLNTDSSIYGGDYSFGENSKLKQVLMHELGHSLGLSHPFYHFVGSNYVLSADFSQLQYSGFEKFGFQINSAADLNKEYFTIMSYDDESSATWNNAYTPMILDVIALQEAYGEGYGTSGSANDTIIAGNIGYRTYFDIGGIDTIDTSSYYGAGAYLRMGESIVGATHNVGLLLANSDATALFSGNKIDALRWFYGEYENANLGAGDDYVFGNTLNNVIYGNLGNDYINGGDGNDTLYGGSGNDIFDWEPSFRSGNDTMSGGIGDDTFVLNSSNDAVIELVGEGDDTIWTEFTYSLAIVSNIENLFLLGSGVFNVSGNSLNNRIAGNSGNNLLTGGAGADNFIFSASNNGVDVISDFEVGDLITVAGALFATPITIGNGVTVGLNQIQSYASNGVTNLYIGTDSAQGYDIKIALNGIFTGEQFSLSSSSITLNAFVNSSPTGTVIIAGTPTQGQTLTASNNLADPDGLGTISYQWKAAGVNINGATGSSHTLTQSEVGKAITVVASYTDGSGTAESKVSSATTAIAVGNTAPVIQINSALSAYVPNGWTPLTSAALNSLLSVTDAQGDPVTQYRIANTTAGANHLQLFMNGTVLSPGQYGTFTAAQVAAGQVYYNGVSAGTDTLTIAAFDGQDWSATPASFNVVVRGANNVAVVSSKNIIAPDISGGTSLSDLVSITDVDTTNYGDTLQQIQLYDSGSNNGYFTYVLNGQQRSVATATPVTLTDAAQISSIKYVASSALGSSELLAIKTYDGLMWSDWQTWNQVSGRSTAPIDTSPTAPALAPLPFTLKAVSGVASWQITFTVTPVSGAAYTLTQIVRQDSPTVVIGSNSNPNITFDINADLNSGDSIVISARGYSGANAAGSVIASSAQLSMSSGFGFGSADTFTSSLGFKLLSLNNLGAVTGLPASFNSADKTLYILVEAPGIAGYSIDSLSQALSAHQVLLQYAAAGQVGIVGLADVVDPMAYSNPIEPSVTVNGVVIPILPGSGTIDNWGALAFKSGSNSKVKVMVSSDNGVTFYQSNQFILGANQTETTGAHALFQAWNNSASSGLVKKNIYFADATTGNPVNGLQMAILPVFGKILSASDWQRVDSYSNQASTLITYTGSVSEILRALGTAESNSLFYVIDTTENISAANAQIYSLVMNGRLAGATPIDGFGHIAMSTSSSDTYLTVSDGNGHLAYLRADRGQSSSDDSIGQKDHAVLAIKTTITSAVTVYVDGRIIDTVSNVNGVIGYTLPSGIDPGTHTITVSASSGTAQIGIVPPGGGFPASYSSSLGLWVGTAAQLPTSLNSIVANTLYVVSDTAANIVSLNGGVAVNTGVINALANTGYLAFDSTTSMSWAQYQQITQATNYPIASVSSLLITDSVYAVGQHIYDINANQQFAIKDNTAHLLSSKFASAAKKISQGQTDSTLSDALKNAVDNHRITWSDSLSSLLDNQNLSEMASHFYGPGQLAGVQVTDSIFNLTQLSSPYQISKLTQLVNQNANGKLTIDIRDSIANVYATLTGTGASAFESKLASVFNQVNALSTRVEINDTVANLKAAYDAGKIATLSNIAQQLFDDVNPGASNTGLGIRVTDTVANITSFLNNTSYAKLLGKVSAFIVSDTAANIVAGLNTQDNSWNSATTSANNIVVKDTYTNVQQYASTLFNSQNNNSVVTKIIFTDVTGATSPIIIGANYSLNGQMPQFDFSQAKGLQGIVTVTETILDQAQINSGAMSAWGNSGIALTIKDSADHQIVINVLSNDRPYNANTYNPDPELLGLNSVILPGEPFMAPSPIASPTPVPEVNGHPILIQGNSAVDSWSITVKQYSVANVLLDTQTYNVKQDSSGANIAFSPNLGGPGVVMSPADYYSVSATGLNGSGAAIATGQLGFNKPNPTFGSTFYLNFPTIDSAGNIANLWAYNSQYIAILSSNLGIGDGYSYSLSALTTALTNNANLAQYAANYQLGIVNLAGTVQPAGINSADPWISVNGLSMWVVGGGLGAWNPIAIKSNYATTVVQYVSFDGGATYQSTQRTDISANTPTELEQWTWQLSSDINTLKTIKVYFTDGNNNPITGLQVAIPPVATGGMLAASDWINVGGGSLEPITIYSGSVAQILSMAIADPAARSVFYIKDTIEHIQSGGDALYHLVQADKILGSTLTNGFSAIARVSTGNYSSIAVTNSAGQVAYIHSTEGGTWMGTQEHAVLAVRASAGTAVPVYIDGQLATNLVAESSGVTALVLPKLFVAGLSTGFHTISLGGGAQLGVVPPGGGWPASYSNSLSIWTGKAAQLPTSISSIVPNTVYIVNDTAANIVALDGYAAVATEVLSTLAATGYLAYNSTTGMTWAQVHQLQQTDDNYAISNISNALITDSVYALENHFWDLNAGQSLAVRDGMARLLSPTIAQASQKMSSGAASNVDGLIGRDALREAFNNHQVSWADSVATFSVASNLSAMKAVYYGAGQLASVMVRDSVANLTAMSSSTKSSLVSFANANASTSLMVSIQDTAANTYTALVGTNPLAFQTALANAFSGVGQLTSRVQINDSVTNLQNYAAYMGQIDTVAKSFFTNVNASAINLGLDFRVTDTVANIESLLVSSTYTAIASKVTSYIVVDTAANLVNAFNGDNWASAADTANNIIVQDSFTNIKNNAATLFAQNNSNNVAVTKINFTDLTGANTSSPLVIKADYSSSGVMPQLDFTKSGLFTGAVTITESVLTSSQISNLGSVAAGAQSGIMLKIADASKEVVIDILSDRTFNGVNNPDPMNTSNLSVLLNSANTKNRIFSLATGNTGTPSDTAYESILNWGANDKINFTNVLSTASNGNNSSAITGQAKLNSSGLAEFSANDDTLNEQINAVAKAIQASGIGAAGKMAYWGNGNDTYVLIEDGILGNNPSAGDNLVKLVGTTNHVALQSGTLGYV